MVSHTTLLAISCRDSFVDIRWVWGSQIKTWYHYGVLFLLKKLVLMLKSFKWGYVILAKMGIFQQLKCNIQNCLIAHISYIASVALLDMCAVLISDT